MRPIKTAATTSVLHKPANWDDATMGECAGLPIAYGDGFISSYWKPTLKDRVLILLGRPIRLSVVGNRTQPPVMLDTEKL